MCKCAITAAQSSRRTTAADTPRTPALDDKETLSREVRSFFRPLQAMSGRLAHEISKDWNAGEEELQVKKWLQSLSLNLNFVARD